VGVNICTGLRTHLFFPDPFELIFGHGVVHFSVLAVLLLLVLQNRATVDRVEGASYLKFCREYFRG
jgi:hypothetical protein